MSDQNVSRKFRVAQEAMRSGVRQLCMIDGEETTPPALVFEVNMLKAQVRALQDVLFNDPVLAHNIVERVVAGQQKELEAMVADYEARIFAANGHKATLLKDGEETIAAEEAQLKVDAKTRRKDAQLRERELKNREEGV